MIKFHRKVATISLIKVFISTTLAPFVGAQIVLHDLAEAFLLAMISGAIMTGVALANILDRYQRYLQQRAGDED